MDKITFTPQYANQPALPKRQINFLGLNRNLGKMCFTTSSAIKTKSDFFTKSNGIVGNIPSEWVKNISKENRGEIIKLLYQEFKRQFSNLEKVLII